jgi:ATP-binding cassette ChvD family protein
VIENIRQAFGDVLAKVDRFNAIGAEMAEPDADFDKLMAEMGRLQDEIDAANGWDIDSQLTQAMNALQCPDADAPVSVLSGGERRRVALCRLLLEAPDLLLLDEPTNHLDAESVLWLEQFLKNYQGAVLAVTHDRYFLDNVAEWICEVDRGQLFPYKGNYSTYLETKAARMAAQGQQQAKLAKRMDAELEWVRSSPKARQAKSKARLERYEQMVAEAQAAKKVDYTEISIPVGPRLGSKVLVADHIHKEFDGRVLIDDLSFTLPRNGIVGVIGPNGVGKTTLFKTIVGLEPLDGGTLEIGETVKISYVDQNRAGIDPAKKLWEVVSGGTDYMKVGDTEIPSRAYVSAFGFKGSDQQKEAGVLSGGERNRLNLALTLKEGGNLLLLDEPTNDLDVETLSSLEAALLEFPGCSVVVSHDRMFLDRVATHILAWEGTEENPGNWHWFEGNFESYQADREARLGKETLKSRRMYAKLTRD